MVTDFEELDFNFILEFDMAPSLDSFIKIKHLRKETSCQYIYIILLAHPPEVIKKILTHLGLESRATEPWSPKDLSPRGPRMSSLLPE